MKRRKHISGQSTVYQDMRILKGIPKLTQSEIHCILRFGSYYKEDKIWNQFTRKQIIKLLHKNPELIEAVI